jgi:TPR repeat protein
MKMDQTTCSGCAQPTDKTYPCAACHCELYCSHACQLAHWPAHKVECKGLAAAFFELVAERARAGDVHGQWYLGQCYKDGTGVAVDDAACFVWYKRAADAGHVKAQSCVGECYRDGRGVAQDDAAAYKWFKRAADRSCMST